MTPDLEPGSGPRGVVTHRIAGVAIRTEVDAHFLARWDDSLAAFRVGDQEPPDLVRRLHRVSPHEQTRPPTEEEWGRLRPEARRIWGELDSPLLRSPRVRASLWEALARRAETKVALYENLAFVYDFARREAALFYASEFGENLPEFLMATCFHYLLRVFLPAFAAVTVHSAGVVRRGQTAVFLAPNGGGKTTLVTELGAGAPIVHDDQIVFRQENSVVRAYPSPLGSPGSSPGGAPIGGLFVLEQASCFDLIPFKAVDAVSLIWAETGRIVADLPSHLKKRAFQVVCDVCFQVPIYRLRFPRHHVDWAAVEAAMEPCP